jgi:hypothetical protein
MDPEIETAGVQGGNFYTKKPKNKKPVSESWQVRGQISGTIFCRHFFMKKMAAKNLETGGLRRWSFVVSNQQVSKEWKKKIDEYFRGFLPRPPSPSPRLPPNTLWP